MPIIRKVFGPFAPEVKHPKSSSTIELRWYFFGIRGDGDMAHWVLVYDPRKRKYLASHTGHRGMDGSHIRRALVEQGIPLEAGPVAHPKMFIEGEQSLTVEGAVTEILKSKLPAAEIAKATALSITLRK